ncbi:LAFA_0E13630g1_1 [Lachancea sp. 'fantastica']|nr:LAFA_0E13630g1_1 [Lachancea sp. 'fantastica']
MSKNGADVAVGGLKNTKQSFDSHSAGEEPPRSRVVYEDDISEMVVGIKRLLAGHDNLNAQVQRMDSKVAQTQVDLEGLVSRSANNNKHLQHLLLSKKEVQKQGVKEQEISKSPSAAENGKDSFFEIQRLRQELDLYKQQNGQLTDLNTKIAQKQTALSDLQTQYELVVAKLIEAQREFEKLRQEHQSLDKQIDQALMEKCKAVENNLAVSGAAFLPPKTSKSSALPMTKMNRITSMLRQNQPNGRRVVSLNIADNVRADGPSNNSEDDAENDGE